MKKLTASLLFLSLLICLAPLGADASAASYPATTREAQYINKTVQLSNDYELGDSGLPALAGPAADDYDSLVACVSQELTARAPKFSIRYNQSYSAVMSLFDNMNGFWADVSAYDDPTTTSDADYMKASLRSLHATATLYSSYSILEFTPVYYTSAQNEAYVDAKVAEILAGLDLGDSSAYQKIKAVHAYILNHVDYDYSLTKYSAYDGLYSGKTVCNGYAQLVYKMLNELDVPTRIITGKTTNSGSVGHAWNIVQIGQYWYNLDATWDDSSQPDLYFLKNAVGFADHLRDPEYLTPGFQATHPMSPTNYDPSQDIVPVNSVAFAASSGQYEMGDVFTLTAQVLPENATVKTLQWTSSNPAVASVKNGSVTVNKAGTARITAAATDGSGKTATYDITALAVLPPSDWAQPYITSLNARGVVFDALKSGYGKDITRAEFTALMANIYEYAAGAYTKPVSAPFTDIAKSAYRDKIVKAYTIGIVGGNGDNLFGPDETLTREQCAKIIATTAGLVNHVQIASDAALPFPDASDISSWAVLFVRYAYQYGLMNGTGENFEPQSNLTREQALTIADGMIEKYNWKKQ